MLHLLVCALALVGRGVLDALLGVLVGCEDGGDVVASVDVEITDTRDDDADEEDGGDGSFGVVCVSTVT